MTLRYEEHTAIVYTELFLFKLISSKKSPGVPLPIREEAQRLLRHYPSKTRVKILFDMEEEFLKIAKKLDTAIQKRKEKT
jgi:hypothetical protein